MTLRVDEGLGLHPLPVIPQQTVAAGWPYAVFLRSGYLPGLALPVIPNTTAEKALAKMPHIAARVAGFCTNIPLQLHPSNRSQTLRYLFRLAKPSRDWYCSWHGDRLVRQLPAPSSRFPHPGSPSGNKAQAP